MNITVTTKECVVYLHQKLSAQTRNVSQPMRKTVGHAQTAMKLYYIL